VAPRSLVQPSSVIWPGRRGDAALAAARQSVRQQHACTHTTAAQPALLRQHWIFAHRVQQGLQEPPYADTAAPWCKGAAGHGEPAIELSIAQSLRVRSCTGWACGCAPHRAPDARTPPRPKPEHLHTPRACAGQQHPLPASCSPSKTDPEHPALAPGTRLAAVPPGMQRPPASTLMRLRKLGASSRFALFGLHWRAPKVGCSSVPFSCAKAPKLTRLVSPFIDQ